ncbi:MAG: ribonuclease T [Gammaproteobacteria bacterium]|nr:ribonuclease T [Gammaproteobacteria bacterium]
MEAQELTPFGKRFRGFYPVVIDVETGGFNATTDALLEIAAVLLAINETGEFYCQETIATHVKPFEGANLEPASLEVNGIDPFHPLRIALPEKEALQKIFKPIREHIKLNKCTRAILVGHNAFFDLGFINAAVERTKLKNNPFHPFSNFDTVTLGALAYSQTVLSRIAEAADIEWDNSSAHSAVYDAEKTAAVFCDVMNKWQLLQA